MKKPSARQAVQRLSEIRNRFGAEYAAEKLALLGAIPGHAVRSSADAQRLHKTLCFIRAFPDSAEVLGNAASLLSRFESVLADLSDAQQHGLVDSGIAGTDIHYHFSYEVATWMARRFPGIIAIDWPEMEDSARLDELLEHLLEHSEADYFDSGHVSTEEWFGIAAGAQSGTDFDWLMSQLGERRQHSRFWTALYNAAEIPLRCRLEKTRLSKTRNMFEAEHAHFRLHGMRNRVPNAKREIGRPLESVRRLDRKDGIRLIDVAMSSLAVRHRETNHFNYANPEEVYVADVGGGISVAVTGLLEEHRYPLETTMGFLILSNGVPIGYGGSSALFRQANTGINIFDEYRGSEAAWLWVQVMRTFRELTGCNRFVANPYQFGSENIEALKSGAFWFYYRLGYRPVEREINQLASAEFIRIKRKKGYRTPQDVLKKLATCDMHLTLLGARKGEFFDERWIELSALLATRELAKTGRRSRRKAQDTIARRLVGELGIESMQGWSREERKWFVRFCPIVAALHPQDWPARDKSALVALMRAKGGDAELDYTQKLGHHERFFAALKRECRRVS